MKHVERIAGIRVADFVAEYIAKNRPVIVTDCMDVWKSRESWTPAYFRERFGNLNTQIYDSLFTLQDVCPLREYLDEYFGRELKDSRNVYARWYVKFKNVDFYWSDQVFDAVADEWSHPYFLPTTSYVMPFCLPPGMVRANRNTFPYKGLFISSRGARTRLHRDPFGTDAILCQFYGTKKLTFYHPSEDARLRRGKEFVDPHHPRLDEFPDFSSALPIHEDELNPGEVLYIPTGWFHDVTCVTDSISVTWNFVHAAQREPFLQAIADPSNDFDRDMLEFFFGNGSGRPISLAEMRRVALSV